MDIRKLTQWVDDYFKNPRKRALSGGYSKELKKVSHLSRLAQIKSPAGNNSIVFLRDERRSDR